MSTAEPFVRGDWFLTRRQRRQPIVLPEDPSEEELARDWTLSEADKKVTLKCRGDPQRRRFALQLCVLSTHGRFLRPRHDIPLRILNHLSYQLALQPVVVPDPPPKEDTELDHQQRIRTHLGYRTFGAGVQQEVERWVYARATEGVLPKELFTILEERLTVHWKVVLPAPSTLERLVSSGCAKAREAFFEQVEASLSIELKAALDELLEAPAGSRRSHLFRFKEYPPEANPKAIGDFIQRMREMESIDIRDIDLGVLSTEMIAHLASVAKVYDAQALKRFAPPKRYTLVTCYLVEQYKTLLDQIVEMNAQYVTGMLRRSENAVKNKRRRLFPQQRFRRTTDTLREGFAMVVERFETEDVLLRTEFFSRFDPSRVRQTLKSYDDFCRLDDRGYVDALVSRYSHLRRYFPAFLSVPFEAEPGSNTLLEAIRMARELPPGKPLPAEVSERVVPPKLRAALRKEDGTLDRRLWEIGLGITIKDALKSGDLYIPASKRHVSFSNMVYSDARWAEERLRAYSDLSLPMNAKAAVARLRAEFEEAVSQATRGLSTNPFVTVTRDGLRLHKGQEDRYQPSVPVRNLRRAIEVHMPKVRIEELLLTVNSWCRFLPELKPRGGYGPRIENLSLAQMAALVAHGTNLGIAAMALATDEVAVDTLQHVTKRFLSEETLRSASATIVDYIHKLPLSSVWGEGTFSSSDGQRFPIRRSSLLGAFYPRYFGYYDRAISVYTHVSDEFSVFSTQAISCSEREALYVLEGLLENDTVLRHLEHTTDTHGYTEHLFGLCFLLSFSFMPRIADLSDQQLYKMDRQASYGTLNPLFRGTVDVSLLEEQWDQLVRVAASIKHRTAKTHDVMQRLVNSSPADRLAKALTGLGRIVKTIYILRYVQDEQLRRRVQLQLNRGEARHGLARRLFFAEHGEFLKGDYEEIMNKASCLSLLSNAVTAWNIVEMTKIVDRLRLAGETVEDVALAHVWPLARRHVIPYGTYRFHLDETPGSPAPPRRGPDLSGGLNLRRIR